MHPTLERETMNRQASFLAKESFPFLYSIKHLFLELQQASPIIADFNLGLLRKGVITKTFSPKVRKVGGISYFVLSLGVFSLLWH